jgi:hypothetical protein
VKDPTRLNNNNKIITKSLMLLIGQVDLSLRGRFNDSPIWTSYAVTAG